MAGRCETKALEHLRLPFFAHFRAQCASDFRFGSYSRKDESRLQTGGEWIGHRDGRAENTPLYQIFCYSETQLADV